MAHELDSSRSAASRAMDDEIQRDIEGKDSHYPDRAYFIDADQPNAGKYILRALSEGYAVVLVSADGQERILSEQRPAA